MPPIAKASKRPVKTLLSLFSFTKTLALAQQLHAQIIVNGLYDSLLFRSKLSDAYVQMGRVHFAVKAFDFIDVKNSHSWNTLASGFFKNKDFSEVLQIFRQMRSEGCPVDSFNLVFAIKACIGLSILQDGKSVHSLAIKFGLERDPYVVPALMDVYTEFGSLEDAQKLFDEISKWNTVICGAMMKGYLKSSKPVKVFELLSKMRTSGFELDPFTSECLVRACGNASAGKEGKSIHGFCLKQNFINSNIYLQTSLVDMYLKCGLLSFGLSLFKEVAIKDVVLWTAIITGFAKCGRGSEAITLFRQMLGESIIPNLITLTSILLACSDMGSLQLGKSVHGHMIRNGFQLDVVNYTSLIDMYANCGLIVGAYSVFKEMPMKNVFSWSAMINGFGTHGLCDEAIALFDQMKLHNQIPNSITFVSILSACSHSGRVEEGWNYFKLMSKDYGITPTSEHFACIVDLLGRAGKIDEALCFIRDMPMEPTASVWGAVLSACRIHKRVDIAKMVAEKLFPLEPDKSVVYVLLCNIYGDAGMWESMKKIRIEIGENGLHKSVGFTSIEVDKKFYFFSSKDRLAFGGTHVEAVLTCLQEQMREFCYEVEEEITWG